MGRLDKLKNMFFPGIGRQTSSPQLISNLSPTMQNKAQELNRWRGPVQLMRIKVDTSIWRSAILEAERPLVALPYRVQMQQMYMDTVMNGHVAACMQKRKDLVLSKKFHICDEHGVTDEAATRLLTKKWFRDGLNYILDAQAYGYSLITFGNIVNGEFDNLQITRRADVSPDREVLSQFMYIPTGIEFNNSDAKDPDGNSYYDWSLYIPTPSENGVSRCGYGYLYKVAVYEIIMRSIIGWNTDYVEKYGQPTAVWSTDVDNEEERAKAEEALRNLASSPFLVKDRSDLFELVGSDTGNGTGWQSYDNLDTRCKKIITSIILGHEDAISSIPGKLGAQQGSDNSAVAQALAEKESADSRFAEHFINNLWIPKLINLGLKLPIGKEFRFKNDLEEQQEKKTEGDTARQWADIALTMKNAGLKMDANTFAEKTGIRTEEMC